MNKTILSLHYLDTYGSEGLASDIKTLNLFRFYVAPIQTAILVRISTGVIAVKPMDIFTLGQALEMLLQDITPDAIRLGYFHDHATIELVRDILQAYLDAIPEEKHRPKIIAEPSMYLDSLALYDLTILESYRNHLFPLTDLVILNTEEVSELTGQVITEFRHLREAAEMIRTMNIQHAILTGGNFKPRAQDVFIDPRSIRVVDAPRYEGANTAGKSSLLAGLMTGYLLRDEDLYAALDKAKKYLVKVMHHNFTIGKGVQPLNLNLPLQQ